MALSKQEKLDWLQRYIIVHSYLYYEKDTNVISDREYDRRAKNLAKIREKYPELWKNSEYFKQFGNDYNGATGFTLYHDLDEYQKEIIRSIAANIIRRR